VPPEVAVALVIGSNIGGAFAPFISQAAAPPAARRVPLGNLLMRLTIAAAALPVVVPIVSLLSVVTPDPARLAINAHTAFNLALAVVFLAAGTAGRAALRAAAAGQAGNRGFRPAALPRPAAGRAPGGGAGLRRARDAGARRPRRSDAAPDDGGLHPRRPEAAATVEASDDAIDRLHEAIKLYLIQVSREHERDREPARYVEILASSPTSSTSATSSTRT
jgi:phosphate:Na+ symporter